MKVLRFFIFLGTLLLTTPTIYAQDYLAKVKEFLDQGDCERARLAYEDYKKHVNPQGNAEVKRRIEECGNVKIPVVTTATPLAVTASTASCGGNITNDGGATITACGICWSTSHNPTINDKYTISGSKMGLFTSEIYGLEMGTIYYVRAFATNAAGTAYGEEVSFTTKSIDDCGTVTDYDGNVYSTVVIGNQCWMKENLRTTHYADGTYIARGSNESYTTGYWYYPFENSANKSTYGLLYNWKAVMRNASSSSANPSGVQGICPKGWHVPSDAEWTQLTDYVGSQSQYRCGNSKDNIAKALSSQTGWNSSSSQCDVGNTPSDNNATGFSALPAGCYYNGYYGDFGGYAHFWSATEDSESRAWCRSLDYYDANVYRGYSNKIYDFSVRCVRD